MNHLILDSLKENIEQLLKSDSDYVFKALFTFTHKISINEWQGYESQYFFEERLPYSSTVYHLLRKELDNS